MAEEFFDKLHNRALKFLSYRPRSEEEVRKNLLRKKSPAGVIEEIISKLKENDFINDLEFARWWVEQRTLIKPRAWRMIKMELKQKGISKEIIEELAQNTEFKLQNDLEAVIKLVRKRLPRYKNLSNQEIYQKMGRYLASKGFDWETIKKGIDEVLGKRV